MLKQEWDGSEKQDDERIIAAAQAGLAQQGESLDATTTQKLNSIRRTVVESGRPRQRWMSPYGYAGAAAAVALFAVVLVMQPATPTGVEAVAAPSVVLSDDFELLTEDIEFYVWLEDELAEAENSG